MWGNGSTRSKRMSENIESAVRLPFDNTYARLPTRFYARIEPDARCQTPAHKAEQAPGSDAGARS